MPPSVDDTCILSPCVTRSTPKRRNTCSSKLSTDDEHYKKSKSSSSLSETSPRRLENPDMMGQSTQESKANQSSPNVHGYVNGDPPTKRRQNDSFLKRVKFRKEERSTSEFPEVSMRSMILDLDNLARSISFAYEKERDLDNSARTSITLELAELRTSYEAAIKESSQLRISNEVAAAENAKLKLENANLVEKCAVTFSKLDELRKQCTTRDAINIGATFVLSKALFLREKAEIGRTARWDSHRLRLENAKLIREAGETEGKGREQILHLQSVLEALVEELNKLRSEKENLIKEKNETEAKTISATHELLSLLAAANEEVKQVRSETEALLRNKDDAVARAADAAALDFHNMKARNETLLREMQAVIEKKDGEIEEMSAVIENTTANVRKVFVEKEEIARQKAESEAAANRYLAQLHSENAALVAEKEKTSATLLAAESKKLRARYDNAVEKLRAEREATGLMKAKMQSVIAVTKSELLKSKKTLEETRADMAVRGEQRAAEIHRLRRDKEESHARESLLLEKLRSRSHSEMHLAFLFNCGLIPREDCNYLFSSRDS